MLRELLARPGVLHLPGVLDPVSARVAVAEGFEGLYLSGAVASATALGLPDLGYVHGTDIAALAQRILATLPGVPLVADADTGYGSVLQVGRTAELYARAGIAGFHLEDQVNPKRCGHLAGKDVVDRDEAVARVKAAVDAGTGLVVIARTDALGVRGLDEARARAQLFADAGADLVFVEGASLEQLAAIDCGVPLLHNRSEAGGALDPWSDEDLAVAGVAAVIHPVSAQLAVLAALRATYSDIRTTGRTRQSTPPWSDLTELLDLPGHLARDR